MDAMQPTTANLQPPAVTTPQPSDPAAASAATADDVTQLPVTFKALLEKLKALKPGHIDAAEATQPADAAVDDTQATDKSDTDLGAQALLAIAASAVPVEALPDTGAAAAALLPAAVAAALPPVPSSAALLPAPTTAVHTDVEAATTVTEAPRGQVGLPIATSADDGKAAPQLSAAPATQPEISAADFAAHGEFLPVTTDPNRAALRSAATDAQAALQGSAAAQAAAPVKVVAAPPAMPAAQISTQVGAAAWGNELGQHMVWMVGQKQHIAELHLNPPHLGPLDITLTIDDKQTTAVFTSPHGVVREAIAAELPRLREVLAESGITLGNASVTADNPRDGQAYNSQQQQRGLPMPGADSAAGMPDAVVARGMRQLGVVDLFA